MKKQHCFFVIFVLFVGTTYAQQTFEQSIQKPMKDITGQPFMTQAYTEVRGTPFLIADWAKGTVTMADGGTYKDMLLKYNEFDGQLVFKDKNDNELIFVEPVKEFTLNYVVDSISYKKLFRNGYKYIPDNTPETFFEVVSDGNVQLLKKETKSMTESPEFNSAVVVKRFEENVKYYLAVAGKATVVKKDKKNNFCCIRK